MQQLTLTYPCHLKPKSKFQVQVGVVSSGDLEVLFSFSKETKFSVEITSTADNSAQRWHDLFDRLSAVKNLPAGQRIIHDFAATPGVARLRIEQALERASYE